MTRSANPSFIVVATLLLTGCSHMSVRDDIAAWVETHCAQRPSAPQPACIVDLATLTGFEWDTMYVFPAGTRQDTVSQIIGAPYPDAETVTERMVFMVDKTIVRSEEHMPDFDGKQPRNVAFSPAPSENGYFLVDRRNGKADAHIETSGSRVFYVLTPLR